ncbi:MAG: glycerate 2-kinase [Verrucomicrobiota bacterium]
MRILIAPDKFKGSLTAQDVAQNIAAGLCEVLPDAKIDITPVADGGEGTAEVIAQARGASWIECEAHDPLGRKIDARYAFDEARKLAVMEMSEAAGMRRLQSNERNVDLATTFGVGEMILDAARHGAQEIIIGLGGSATNDGGFGFARALGFQFFDAQNYEIEKIVDLIALERIERPTSLLLPKIIAAVDVQNPLLGENGATRIFGPQKGVTPDKIDMFERALTKLADVATKTFRKDYRDERGAGAAGGLGFGLMTFCKAIIKPGFDVVAEAVDLEARIKDVDVVITGEGSLDRQTLEGKAPAGVARLAKKFAKRVFAIVGIAKQDGDLREMFERVYELGGTIPQAPELLRERARELGNHLRA